jgi:NADP-dependent 3-hydroxy acid dehydrogenase YdfG
MANYWATCLLIPSGGAVSLVNNGASKASEFTAAIAGSYRTTDTQPYYQHFIQAIEDVAKTIVWVVTLPSTPFIRTETVS